MSVKYKHWSLEDIRLYLSRKEYPSSALSTGEDATSVELNDRYSDFVQNSGKSQAVWILSYTWKNTYYHGAITV